MTATIAIEDERRSSEAPVDPGRVRLGLAVWALLFFNGLAYTDIQLLIPIPHVLGKFAPQGALFLAAVLVLVFNRDRLVRPNLFLTLYTLLATSALLASLRLDAGKGGLLRSGRFIAFVAVLWLLTPLWGRRDRILLHWHVICLTAIVGLVALGGLIDPGRAQKDGRLYGFIWPVPSTQVGHYAAALAGIVIVLVLAGTMRPRLGVPIAVMAVVVLLLSHTRTATVGLIVGVFLSMLTLALIRRRARRAVIVTIISVVVVAALFTPVIKNWYTRGQTTTNVETLSGRKKVWDALLSKPRSEFELIFGHGLSDKSFGGLPIDNSWYSTYADEGLVGDALCAAILICLLMLASTRPRGPSLAVAIFIIVYCAIASMTETGLGDVSPYVLDLTVAAALLAAPVTLRSDALAVP
jgi:hypothetical protein